MNHILYSKNESFEEGAKKIKNEALGRGKECEIIELEDVLTNKYEEKFKREKILVYFLASDQNIPKYVEFINKIGGLVINNNFLLANISTSKFDSLQKIKMAGLSTPTNIPVPTDLSEIEKEISFPIFIKTKRPIGTVDYIENKDDLLDKMRPISEINEYYLEEIVNDIDTQLHKFYYVNGDIFNVEFEKKEEQVPEWFKVILNKISDCTDLQVFSIDFFVNWSTNKYYCIDVNHASAFFKSDSARKTFINNILI